MTNNKDKRAKYINVPIRCYDEMEFIFQEKHATREYTVLQAPYDRPSTKDGDLVGDKNATHIDVVQRIMIQIAFMNRTTTLQVALQSILQVARVIKGRGPSLMILWLKI